MTSASPSDATPRPTYVIQPDRAGFDWAEIWHFRELFLILAQRDVKLRYRQTLLGVVWVVLQPLAAALIFAWVFGSLAQVPSDGEPYVLFVFAALLPWLLFSQGVQRAGNSLITDARLITKVYFPRAVVPIASTAGVLVDFAVASVVMAVLMVIYAQPPNIALVILPLLILMTAVVTIGLSLCFSALNIYYRDFAYALPFIMQVWLYASPVVYPSSLIPPEWLPLYGLNPLVGIIDGFRWAVFGGAAPVLLMLESAVVGLILLAVGAAVFRRVERNFADVV